ncbi:MAG: MliC family protein [Gammaproteobacteria bacterium]|nr:MliC family protein [Gammaproteobacteria bacterium]
MNRASTIILSSIMLNSCAYTQPDDVSPDSRISTTGSNAQTYVYECPDDFSFVARTETDRAWLFLPGTTLELALVQSASGTKYTNGSVTFWRNNNEAVIKSEEIKHTGCNNNRARAIWEHAKLNGVDFRALGNEPGWYMEISNKQDILLVTGYGQQTYRFTSAIINSYPHDRTTSYHAQSNGNSVEIIIKGMPCQDSMSGEAFSAAVTVLINNKRYMGCGKALH